MESKKRKPVRTVSLLQHRQQAEPKLVRPSIAAVQEQQDSTCELSTLRVEELKERCIQGRPPQISRRVDKLGKPSNGNQQQFEHSFSVTDPSGIKYDFRDGLRVMIPANMKGEYIVTAYDAETHFIHFRTVLKPGESANSRKRYYIPWRLVVEGEGVTVDVTMDLKGKEVAIHYPKGGLGDLIAWFSYAEAFQQKYQCNLTCCLPSEYRDLFEPVYPNIKWATEFAWKSTPFYAVYHMGIFLPDNENDKQPLDFRMTGLHHNAANILGLPHKDMPPRVDIGESPVTGKYVCIASRASARCKEWLNPSGWPAVVSWLKDHGYAVYDIDKDFIRDNDVIPFGAIDMTGAKPLKDRAAVIKGAAAFIRTSSGLSWLAWCCGTPVVLISGWTLPITEFYTPYRVINWGVCHGCWNDPREEYDHTDSNYCPRHKGTGREGECSRGIPAKQVIDALKGALRIE